MNVMDLIAAFAASPEASPSVPSVTPETQAIIAHDNEIPIDISVDLAINQSLTLLCFSRDRPYQLSQFLRSTTFLRSNDFDIKVIVLYSPGIWKEHYSHVFSQYPAAKDVLETNFADDVRNIIANCNSAHLLFAVDDMVFHSEVDIRYSTATSINVCHSLILL